MTQKPAVEKAVVESVSKERLMADTGALAEWIRLSGSEEERESFDYVEGRLREMGLSPSRYSGRAYVSLPVSAELSAGGEDLAAITHSMAVSTPEGGLELPLVYAGEGTAADYAELDVRGKISLIDGMAMPGKVMAAQEAGAAACICANGDRYVHEMVVSPVWGSPTPETRTLLPRIPVASVGADEGERLVGFAREEAAVRLETRVDTGWTELPTLTAQVDGTVEPEKFVLFSGHIDSWHYGAMDNGSANATMLEVMRVLLSSGEKFHRSIRVAFWSGHSHGRYSGSTWYADNFWEDLHDNCVMHLNVDSVGGRNANVLTEGHTMVESRPVAASVIKEQTGVEFTGTRFGRAGDQSFIGHGIPSLFMSLSEQDPNQGDSSGGFAQLIGGGSDGRSGGLGWWWHTTEDTVDKIDPELLVRDARIYAGIAYRLVCEPLVPVDPSAAARELAEHLTGWQEKASGRFDLSVPIERAQILSGLCDSLAERLAAGDGEEDTVKTLNEAVQDVERTLVRLDYTRGDPYAHDPALSQPAVPALAPINELLEAQPGSDEESELLTQLVRRRNHIKYELSQANERLVTTLGSL